MVIFDFDSNIVFKDGITLYTVRQHKSEYLFDFWETKSFEHLGEFTVEALINPEIVPIVDIDCIYFATTDGLIVGIDKFSGYHVTTCELGQMWASDRLYLDDKNIYSLCSIPINFKNQYSVCISDKSTGCKLFQSPYIEKTYGKIVVDKKQIFVLYNSMLVCYDDCGAVIREIRLDIDFYEIVVDDNSIYCFSKIGIVKIFDRVSFKEVRRIFVAQSDKTPVMHNHTVYWFTTNGGYKINREKFEQFDKKRSYVSPLIECRHKLFYYDKNTVMCHDIESGVTSEVMKNHNFPDAKLFSVGDKLLLTGEKTWDVQLI